MISSGDNQWESLFRWGVLKTLWGKSLFLFGKQFRSFGRLSLYWGVILGWRESEVSCYPVGFQASKQLAGEFGEIGRFPSGIDKL